MSEGDLMRRIQIACCEDPHARLWRNNVGEAWQGEVLRRFGNCITLANVRRIHAGLGTGTGDLIGGVSKLITLDMVGQRVFVFANVEVKTPKGRVRPEQKAFIAVVKALGGIADIARDENEARKVLTLDSM